MAKPRPPVIISNGGMKDKFDKRRNKLEKDEDITDILYDSEESGIASLVTLENRVQFVFWRTTDNDDKTFTERDKTPYISENYPLEYWEVATEIPLNF